jgi:hypothetical protein
MPYVRAEDGSYVQVDQYGNPVNTMGGAVKYAMPPEAPMSYTDIARAEKKGNEKAAAAAGIAALGTAAQIGMAALPTAADIENKRRLAALAKHKGLDQATRAEIDEQAMRKVGAVARESQARTDDALASSGNTSARDLFNARLAEKEAVNRITLNASDIGIQANREQVRADTQEEQERIGYQAGRQREVRGLIGKAIGEGVLSVAKPFASGIVKDEPTDAQLLYMRDLKDDRGEYVYAGLQGTESIEDLRMALRKMEQDARKADGATRAYGG